jgi:PPM family protein phosphatase
VAIVVPDPDTPAGSGMLRWSAHGVSDRGRVRGRNEDALLLLPGSRVHAVADGMGGHAAGDVASRLAVETLAAAFEPPTASAAEAAETAERLVAVIHAANAAILRHAAEERACLGMGTTLTALVPLAGHAACVIGHVGDSRAYRLRRGALAQLTRDHTWVQQQVDAGMLTVQQARHHQRSSILLRVLGADATAPADTLVVDAEPGDVFMLCSDGLTNMLEDDDVLALLAAADSLPDRCDALVAEANRRGGVDNITVLLLSVAAP